MHAGMRPHVNFLENQSDLSFWVTTIKLSENGLFYFYGVYPYLFLPIKYNSVLKCCMYLYSCIGMCVMVRSQQSASNPV